MKLKDLSKIDQETLFLRGASGGFKPENQKEIEQIQDALKNGATPKIKYWLIEDYDDAIKWRNMEYKNGPLDKVDPEIRAMFADDLKNDRIATLKMADFSPIDKETLFLRGATGGFKPEDTKEMEQVQDALKKGASTRLEYWLIEDYPPAIARRADMYKDIPADRLDVEMLVLLDKDIKSNRFDPSEIHSKTESKLMPFIDSLKSKEKEQSKVAKPG